MLVVITHHPNLTWQHKVIECLAEFGVDVNPEEVLRAAIIANIAENMEFGLY